MTGLQFLLIAIGAIIVFATIFLLMAFGAGYMHSVAEEPESD